MRKITALLLSAVLLVGCSSTTEFGEVSTAVQDSQSMQGELDSDGEGESPDAPSVEEPSSAQQNRWLRKCEEFSYASDQSWADAYREIISDVCSTKSVNPDVIDIIYGPETDPSDPLISAYTDTALFAWSFWEKYVPEFARKTTFIVITPDDGGWWEENAPTYTSVPQGELGSCAYFDENNFCSYKYFVDDGNSNIDSDIILWVVREGSPLKEDTYVDPAHNAAHWFHDAYGFKHWYEFLIEGHATLFEIAFHILENSNEDVRIAERQRESFAWLSHTVDNFKFTAETVDEANAHFDKCYGRGGDCNHFYYGGAAMFHENLILNYGYEAFMEWGKAMGSVETTEEFNSLFDEMFSRPIDSYQRQEFASHVVETFSHYYEIWD